MDHLDPTPEARYRVPIDNHPPYPITGPAPRKPIARPLTVSAAKERYENTVAIYKRSGTPDDYDAMISAFNEWRLRQWGEIK